jgi:hypothetical protein
MQDDLTFELFLEPETAKFDPADDRWREQVAAFYRDLDDEVGGLRREVTPVAESKGGVEAIILALGSAGVVPAAVQFFKSWLSRDRSRSLKVCWMEDGKRQCVSVEGDGIGQEALNVVAAAAAQRIGGAGWQAQATKPS